MDDATNPKSPVTELATSPTSTVSAGRDYLSNKELILRLNLLDSQRQRGKITQSRYEAKRKDLLCLCSNADFRYLVLQNGTRLIEGEIDQAGYEKRLRFLISKIDDSGAILETHERFEDELKASGLLDKKSRRPFDIPRLPKDLAKPPSPEQRSPEEEKFFASDAEQGWAFQKQTITRSRSVGGSSSASTGASSSYSHESHSPASYSSEPPARGGFDPNGLYGSQLSLGYGSGIDPFEGDGWRINVASAEPRGDVERPIRSATK